MIIFAKSLDVLSMIMIGMGGGLLSHNVLIENRDDFVKLSMIHRLDDIIFVYWRKGF